MHVPHWKINRATHRNFGWKGMLRLNHPLRLLPVSSHNRDLLVVVISIYLCQQIIGDTACYITCNFIYNYLYFDIEMRKLYWFEVIYNFIVLSVKKTDVCFIYVILPLAYFCGTTQPGMWLLYYSSIYTVFIEYFIFYIIFCIVSLPLKYFHIHYFTKSSKQLKGS